ncbi:hypothetical protein GGR57DRAFT_242858 [Xylariaceae sp. FL1272]|nr:hypothetical protein GGR57DRAFT_242858 [Xylariaceae sp. FL1272]
MSGFEIAGVVLGAIPLVISALEHYKAGKGPAATFFKWRDQLDTLIFRLKLQKSLLHLDLLELLRSSRIEEALEQDLTEEECLKVLRDPGNGKAVQESLGLIYETFLEVLRRYEACLVTLAEKLAHIQGPPGINKGDLAALVVANNEKAISFKKRVKFTIEKTVLRDLVEELREDRLSLQAIIKAMRTQKERTNRRPSYEAGALARVFELVRQSMMPLFTAIRTGCTCKCSNHRVLMRLDSQTRPDGESHGPLRRNQIQQDFSFDLMLDRKGEFHQTIVTTRQKHGNSIEVGNDKQGNGHVKFGPSIMITSTNELLQDIHEPRTVTDICEAICQARSTSRILQLELINQGLFFNSTGCIQEPYRERPPLEFLDLFLRKGYDDYDFRMTPKQQTLLALDVASAVLQLRQTCWLGANFRSASMHILLDECVDGEANSPSVFVEKSVHESTALVDATTSSPDPKATLLELAIILLEIWHHQPLDECIAKLGLDNVDTLENRRIAAIRWLERTSSRLPLYHLAAIEECLAVCSGRLRYWNDKEFVREYCENIIKPLRESCKSW